MKATHQKCNRYNCAKCSDDSEAGFHTPKRFQPLQENVIDKKLIESGGKVEHYVKSPHKYEELSTVPLPNYPENFHSSWKLKEIFVRFCIDENTAENYDPEKYDDEIPNYDSELGERVRLSLEAAHFQQFYHEIEQLISTVVPSSQIKQDHSLLTQSIDTVESSDPSFTAMEENLKSLSSEVEILRSEMSSLKDNIGERGKKNSPPPDMELMKRS